MVQQKFKLAEGRSVPMEDGRDWPAEGATVEVTHYIRRRLADGDLVECDVAAATRHPEQDPAAPEEPSEPDDLEVQTGRKARNGGK